MYYIFITGKGLPNLLRAEELKTDEHEIIDGVDYENIDNSSTYHSVKTVKFLGN